MVGGDILRCTMLGELTEIQEPSEESVDSVSMSFDVRTRDTESEELVERVYTFCYAPEWDKWTFQEFLERRSPDTLRMSDRNWRRVKHCLWHEAGETPDIDVPPQVAEKLSQATGAESVTIQVPRGKIDETVYETVVEYESD